MSNNDTFRLTHITNITNMHTYLIDTLAVPKTKSNQKTVSTVSSTIEAKTPTKTIKTILHTRSTTKQSQKSAIPAKKPAVLIVQDQIVRATSTCECDSNIEVFQTV